MSYRRDGRWGLFPRLIKIPDTFVFGWPNHNTSPAIHNSKINRSRCCLCPQIAVGSFVRALGGGQFRVCRPCYLDLSGAIHSRDGRASVRGQFESLFNSCPSILTWSRGHVALQADRRAA
jgi:hypothetical protein